MESTLKKSSLSTEEIIIGEYGEVYNLKEYDEAMRAINEWYADHQYELHAQHI